MAPTGTPNRPQEHPKRPEVAPKGSKREPKRSKMAAGRFQDLSAWAPGGSKTMFKSKVQMDLAPVGILNPEIGSKTSPKRP